MRRTTPLGLIAALLALLIAPLAHAGTCKEDDFGRVIDSAGAAIRTINAEMAPELDRRLATIRARDGLDDAAVSARASAAMQSAKVREADRQVSELLGRIDALGDFAEGETPDCSKLADLEANVVELRATMRSKWAATFASLEPPPKPKSDPAVKPKASAVAKPRSGETLPWSTDTEPEPGYQGESGPEVAALPEDGPTLMLEELNTYSIEEIEGAGRGFFGTISVGLASVIAHVFEKAGRPSGYILGKEGGGAIIAGLRYGAGRLHTKLGGSQKLYWQGPSIGYDLGAEGARTMILVYNLKSPEAIYAHFGGIDGSAYLVGGVGVTFITDGGVILAPIRSGLGLRLGANIGYLKFTPERTWNPF